MQQKGSRFKVLPKNSCKSMKSDTNQLDSKGVTECGSKNTAFYQVDCGNTAYTYHGILLIL